MTELQLAGKNDDEVYRRAENVKGLFVKGMAVVMDLGAEIDWFKENPDRWHHIWPTFTDLCWEGFKKSPSYCNRARLAFLMPGDEPERVKREARRVEQERLENAGEPAAAPAGEPTNEPTGEPDVAAVLDARGVPVTEERFQRIFAHSDRFGSIMRSLKSLKREISDLDSMPAGEVLHEQIQAIERDRRNIYSAVKFSKPWAVCPYCGGSASHSECGGCKGRGWVTKEVFDQSPAT